MNKEPIGWTAGEVAEAAGGRLLAGEPSVPLAGVGIDSRTVLPGTLFVAIRGEHHDGHRFVPDAVAAGARGVLVVGDRVGDWPVDDWGRAGTAVIGVDDTLRALGALGTAQRRRAGVRVIAITGSNGKTSTREMTASVISRRFVTLQPKKNFNNEIGLPLTLLSLSADHQVAVVELGMNAPGEIRRLTRICEPDIGLITNIGPAHLEGVGSIEGVAAAKAELFEEMAPTAAAAVNADDDRVVEAARRTGWTDSDRRCVRFGMTAAAEVKAEDIAEEGGHLAFTLAINGDRVPVHLAVPGRFMVINAVAAAAAGHIMGLTPAEIAAGLGDFRPVDGRMRIRQTESGVRILDDTYNANPGSMAAAITALRSLAGTGRAVLVIGDMYELGSHAEALHREVGVAAAEAGIQRLYVVGQYAETVAGGASAAGMDHHRIMTGSRDEVARALADALRPDDWVLIKGSRAMGMETIVHSLVDL